MKRLLLIVVAALAACSASTPSAGPSSPSPSRSPCIDRAAVISKANAAGSEMTDAAKALAGFDKATATAKFREAADTTRAVAALVESAAPLAAQRFRESADSLDRAGNSAEAGDLETATSQIEEATTLVKDGTAEITSSDVFAC